jgi:hypothetical protein
MIQLIRRWAYLALGTTAVAVGSVLFIIVTYQLFVLGLRDRIGAMILFGWAIYLGIQGVNKGRRISD